MGRIMKTTMLSRYLMPKAMHLRLFSGKVNLKMNETVSTMLENEELKPKHHPGIIKRVPLELPNWLITAIKGVLKEQERSTIYEEGQQLTRYLYGRQLPTEKKDLQSKYFYIQQSLLKNYDKQNLSEDEMEKLVKTNHGKVLNILKRKVYSWAPIEYNAHKSLVYLVGRSASNYAALYTIFNEIHTRDKKFKPKTLFDFGSGVGTVTWAAAQFWVDTLKEYLCVDCSSHMNDLAEKLVRNATPQIKEIYHRQFFPVSRDLRFDIVVSAYSLMELPSVNDRLETILNLWRKTEKYLVIVESGTRPGFAVINEARAFILHLYEAKVEKKPQSVHVFSPCPHDLECPRHVLNDIPCNFEARYCGLKMFGASQIIKERYSYVVFQKGKRHETDEQWPRLIEDPLLRSKHTICRMCTASGKLQEMIFTASKHGKLTYRCAKVSKCGDRLPIQMHDVPIEEGNE